MKILNLYAGVGGNRKLWGDEHEITAIEYNEEIAKAYQDFFPNDKVIIADAHQYLLDHFKEFDFIWSSPPCPTHSRARKCNPKQNKPIYPDMQLYQQILLLKGYFKGKWVVENVISWYDPLIKPYELDKHYYWSNFNISELGKLDKKGRGMGNDENIEDLQKLKGFDLSNYKFSSKYPKLKILRNCVEPHAGLHIFNCAFKQKQEQLSFLGGS